MRSIYQVPKFRFVAATQSDATLRLYRRPLQPFFFLFFEGNFLSGTEKLKHVRGAPVAKRDRMEIWRNKQLAEDAARSEFFFFVAEIFNSNSFFFITP